MWELVFTGCGGTCDFPDSFQHHCSWGNSKWTHLLCQHNQNESCHFFPPQTFNILTIFMAWINLDLGIELLLQWHRCICNGLAAVCISTLHLDNYDICHCSQPKIPHCCKTIIGKNAVKVLATLFLLSYTKILRTIITVFSFTDITYPDNSKRYVWLYDGNVDYLRGKHIYLFAKTIVFLFVVVLLYTLVLVFVQSLQAKSEWKILSWVNKLKPLFDAYTGPYCDKYYFWTGFLLLIRSILSSSLHSTHFVTPVWIS